MKRDNVIHRTDNKMKQFIKEEKKEKKKRKKHKDRHVNEKF